MHKVLTCFMSFKKLQISTCNQSLKDSFLFKIQGAFALFESSRLKNGEE